MRVPIHQPEFRSWTMSDGYELRGRHWPGRRGGPAIIYLHGIQSHGGWYEWSASKLAQTGATVIMPDRRGSGMNEASRGDVPGADRWLRDIDELADWVRQSADVQRPALVGVSWGGKLAALWANERRGAASDILLIAPGLFPQVDLRLHKKLAVAWSFTGGGRRMFEIPLCDPALFTENVEGQAFIRDDKLKLTHVTGRFLLSSARLDRKLARAPACGLTTRCTLLLAGRDRIIRNAATEEWLQRACGVEPRVVQLEHASHTMEFEADPAAFEAVIGDWRDGLISVTRNE